MWGSRALDGASRWQSCWVWAGGSGQPEGSNRPQHSHLNFSALPNCLCVALSGAFCLEDDIWAEPGALSHGQLLPFQPGPWAQLLSVLFPRGSFCQGQGHSLSFPSTSLQRSFLVRMDSLVSAAVLGWRVGRRLHQELKTSDNKSRKCTPLSTGYRVRPGNVSAEGAPGCSFSLLSAPFLPIAAPSSQEFIIFSHQEPGRSWLRSQAPEPTWFKPWLRSLQALYVGASSLVSLILSFQFCKTRTSNAVAVNVNGGRCGKVLTAACGLR